MNKTEHLLTCLSEECIEVAKDVSKALRFGLDDHNVLNPAGPSNRERIQEELNDLMSVVKMLGAEGIIDMDWSDLEKQRKKKAKVEKFMDYAKTCGALQP